MRSLLRELVAQRKTQVRQNSRTGAIVNSFLITELPAGLKDWNVDRDGEKDKDENAKKA